MNDKIIVSVGDKVINIHTDEIFVVESIFQMRKIGGGKYTPNNTWRQDHVLSSQDWKIKQVEQDENGNITLLVVAR